LQSFHSELHGSQFSIHSAPSFEIRLLKAKSALSFQSSLWEVLLDLLEIVLSLSQFEFGGNSWFKCRSDWSIFPFLLWLSLDTSQLEFLLRDEIMTEELLNVGLKALDPRWDSLE